MYPLEVKFFFASLSVYFSTRGALLGGCVQYVTKEYSEYHPFTVVKIYLVKILYILIRRAPN